MPKFTIPYEWTVSGSIEIEAADLATATELVFATPLEQLHNEFAKGSFVMRRNLVQEANPSVTSDELDAVDDLEE